MPTYVYRCRDCGREFEHFEKMTSRVKTRRCPACSGRGERQISGGAGFLFKGEGFYITDYRSDEYRSKHKAETEKAAPAVEPAAQAKPAAPESAADKTAAKPVAAKKPRGGPKKKKR
jgi:putative FmdB family regulatory protein